MRTDDLGVIQQQLDQIIELLGTLIEQTAKPKGVIPYGPISTSEESESSVTKWWNPETAARAWREWQAKRRAQRS